MENIFYLIKEDICKLSFLILSSFIHIRRNLSFFNMTHVLDTTLVIEEQRKQRQDS